MKGIVVANPHGDLAIEGTKSLIVKDATLSRDLGTELVLIQGNTALGIVILKTREPIYLSDIEGRVKEHRIAENERRRWWPNVDKLWGFGFDVIEVFEPPKKIFRDKSERLMVNEVVFKDDDYYAAIKRMFSGDVNEYRGGELLLVHRLLHSFFSRRKDGDRVVLEGCDRSLPDIVERHSMVVGAIEARSAKHEGPEDDLNSMSRPFEALASLGSGNQTEAAQ